MIFFANESKPEKIVLDCGGWGGRGCCLGSVRGILSTN